MFPMEKKALASFWSSSLSNLSSTEEDKTTQPENKLDIHFVFSCVLFF